MTQVKGCSPLGLSADGTEPASHFISSGPIANEFGDLLPLTSFDEEGAPTTRPGDVATVEAIADQAGITLPAGTIAALFAAIDVTEQEPFTAMARLGADRAGGRMIVAISRHRGHWWPLLGLSHLE